MKKSLLITIGVLSTVAVVGVSVPTAVILSNKNNKKPNPDPGQNPEAPKSDTSTLENDIKYVAIGDSIAAGYNARFGHDQGGYLNTETNTIEGLSYPSYIANAIKMTNDSKTKLTSYQNFALTGTTLDEWIYLLDPSSYTDTQQLAKVKTALSFDMNIDRSSKNPIRMYGQHRLEYLFDDFNVKNNEVGKLTQSIKEANLLTISLGANDFLNEVDLFQLISVLGFENEDVTDAELEKIYNEFNKTMAEVSKKIIAKYKKLIAKIRQINPDININIISYPMPFVRIAKLIDKKYAKITPNLAESLIRTINKTLKTAANENAANYINSFNEDLWEKEAKVLSSNVFDIHPDIAGYKKMAQDVFLKMSMNPNKPDAQLNVNEKFLESDKGAYKQVLNFSSYSNNNLKLLIYGVYAVNSNTVDTTYSFEQNLVNQRIIQFISSNPDIDVEHIVRNYIDNNKEIFKSNNFKQMLSKGLNNFGLSLKAFPNLESFLDSLLKSGVGSEFIPKMVNAVLDTGTISLIFNNIRRDIDSLLEQKSSELIKTKDISLVIQKNLLNLDVLYQGIRKFALSDFVKDNSQNVLLQKTVKAIIQDFMEIKNIAKLLPLKLRTIIQNIDFDKKVTQKITNNIIFIANNVIANTDKFFKDSLTINQFLVKVYQNYQKQIKSVVYDVLVEVLNTEKLDADIAKEIVDLIVSEVQDPLQKTNRQQIEYMLTKFLNTLPKKPYFKAAVEKFIDLVFKNIKNDELDFKKIITPAFLTTIFGTYPGNENSEVVIGLLSDNFEDPKYNQGFRKLIDYVLGHNYLNEVSLNELMSKKDDFSVDGLKSLVINLVNSKLITKNKLVKDNMKYILGTFLDSNVLNNKLIPQFISLYSQGNVVNRIYQQLDDLNLVKGLDVVFSEQGGIHKTLNKWFSSFIDDLLKDDQLKKQLKDSLFNIIDNLDKFEGKDITEVVKNALKNIEIAEPKKLIDSLVDAIINSHSGTLGLRILFSSLEEFSGVRLNDTQRDALIENVNEVLRHISKSKLVNDILDTIKYADTTKATTLAEVIKALVLNINNYFDFKNIDLWNDILSVIVARDEDNKINVPINKWLETLKPIFGNEKVVDFIFSKTDLKELIIKKLADIDVSQNNWSNETLEAYKNFIENAKTFINNNFESITNQTLKNIFKGIFSDNSIQLASESPSKWFDTYVIKNAISNILNVSETLLQAVNNDSVFKDSLITFVTYLIKEYTKDYVTINDEQLNKLKHTVSTIIDQLTSKKIIDLLANEINKTITASIHLSDDVVLSKFNFEDITKSININSIIEIISQADLDKIITLLNNKDIANLIDIVNSNKEKLFKIITNKIDSLLSPEANNSNANPSEPSNSIIDIDKLIKILLKHIPQLVKNLNNTQEAIEVANNLSDIVSYALTTDKVKEYVIKTVKNLYPELKKVFDVPQQNYDDLVTYVVNNVVGTEQTHQLFNGIFNSILTENPYEIDNVDSLLDLVKVAVTVNVQRVSEYLGNVISDQKLQDELAKILTQYVVTRFEANTIETDIYNNIKQILAVIPQTDVIDSLLENISTTLQNVQLDDPNDLAKLKDVKFFDGFDYSTLLNKHTIKTVARTLFNDDNIDSLYNIAIFFIDKFSSSQDTNNQSNPNESTNTENNTEQKQKLNKLIVGFLNKFANSLDATEDAKVIENIAKLSIKITSHYVNENLNLDSIQWASDTTKQEIKNMISEIVNNPTTLQMINDILSDYLTTDKYEDIETLHDVVNTLITNNVDTVTNKLKEMVINFVSVEDNQDKLIDIALEFLEYKLKIDVQNNLQYQEVKDSIKNLAKLVINNIKDNPVVDTIIGVLKDVLLNNGILTADDKLNNELPKEIQKAFEDATNLEQILAKENIRSFIKSIFDEKHNEDIKKVLKFFTALDYSALNDSSTPNPNPELLTPQWLVDILVHVSGSLETTDTDAINNMTSLVQEFASEYITDNLDLSGIQNVSDEIKDKLTKLITDAVNDPKITQLINHLITNYLTSQDYKQYTTLHDLVNNLVKNNLQEVLDTVKQFVTEFLNKTDNQDSLINIAIEFIESKIKQQIPEIQKQALTRVLKAIIKTLPGNSALDDVLEIVKNAITNNNVLTDKDKFNEQLPKELLKAFKDTSNIETLLDSQNIRPIVKTLFDTDEHLDDLFTITKFFIGIDYSSLTAQNTDSNTQSSENSTDWIIKILSSVSGSLIETDDDQAINNIAKLIIRVAKDYVQNSLNLESIEFLTTEAQNDLKLIIVSALNNTHSKDIIVNILKDFLVGNKYKQLPSISELVNTLVKSNVDNVVPEIKLLLKDIISENKTNKNITNLVIHLLEHSLSSENHPFTIKEHVKEALHNVLNRALNNIDQNSAWDIAFSTVTDILKSTDILTNENKFNKQLVDNLKNKFSSQELLGQFIAKENIQKLLVNVLDINGDNDAAISDVLTIYKWIREDVLTRPYDGPYEDDFDTIAFVTKVLKHANGILEGADNSIKPAVIKLVKQIAEYEIEAADFSSFINSEAEITKAKELLKRIVEFDSTGNLLNIIVFKFLNKEYDLSAATDLNQIIKEYIKLAKTDTVDNIEAFINELINKESDSLIDFAISAINKQLKTALNTDQEEAIKRVTKNIFEFIKSNTTYKDVITKILEALQEVDFIKDKKLNSEGISKAIKDKFSLEVIQQYITKQNAKDVITKVFKDDQAVSDFVAIYKGLRDNINFNISSTGQNDNNQTEEQQQKQLEAKKLLFKFIASILKALNGSVEDATESGARVGEVISQIVSYEFARFDADEFKIDTVITNSTINTVIHSIADSTELKNAIKNIVTKYLTVSDQSIQSANNLNDVLKALVKSNIEDIKNSVVDILKLGLSKDENERLIATDICEYLNKKYNLGYDKDSLQGQAFIKVVSKALDVLPNQEYVQNLIKEALGSAVDVDLLDGVIFNKQFIQTVLDKIVKNTDFTSIINKDMAKDVINILIPTEELISNNEQINTEQVNKIYHLFEYIYKLANKISETQNTDSSTENTPVDTEKYRKIEDIILKAIMAFNNVLGNNTVEKADQKLEIIKLSATKIIRKIIAEVDYDNLLKDKPNINKDKVKRIVNEIANYPSVHNLISTIIEDILKSDLTTWSQYQSGDETSLARVMALVIKHEQGPVIRFFKDTIRQFFTSDQNTRDVTQVLFRLLNLENTDSDDEALLSGILKRLMPKLVDNNWFENKVLNRSFWWLSKKAPEFKLENPLKWITDAFDKVKGGLGTADAGALLDFIGDSDSMPINAEQFTKLINLVLGKSNFADSLIYNGLRELNRDPNVSKRTNRNDLDAMVGSNIFEAIGKLIPKKPSTPADENPAYWVTPEKGIFDFVAKGYEMIGKTYQRQNLPDGAWNFKTRRQNFAYKAMYRYHTLLLYAIFQTYFRETRYEDRESNNKFIHWRNYGGLSHPSIVWLLQEDKVDEHFAPYLHKGLREFTASPDRWTTRNELGSHYRIQMSSSDWRYAAADNGSSPNGYRPDDIVYILGTSEFPANDPARNNYSTDVYFGPSINGGKKLSKRDYVLKTIHAGSWGDFMKQANLTSMNVISGFAKARIEKAPWWAPWQSNKLVGIDPILKPKDY